MTFLKIFCAQNKLKVLLYLMGTKINRLGQNLSLWQPLEMVPNSTYPTLQQAWLQKTVMGTL